VQIEAASSFNFYQVYIRASSAKFECILKKIDFVICVTNRFNSGAAKNIPIR